MSKVNLGTPSPYERNRPKRKGPKKLCDRCGFTFYEDELSEQKGLKVCKGCLDLEEGSNV